MAEFVRTEKIADLFLHYLSKQDADSAGGFLHNFLDENGIYYDYPMLSTVLSFLKGEELIEDVKPGFAVISYDRSGDFFKALDKTEGVIAQSAITDKGRRFVELGQELDKQGVVEREAAQQKIIDKREAEVTKRNDRLINIAIVIVTAVVVTLATEPIKKYFQKDSTPTDSIQNDSTHTKSKPVINNASSAVRPSLDSGQRPESRKPTRTATTGSGARR